MFSHHFKYTSHESCISKGEMSKPSIRCSIGTITLSIRADAFGVDDYSGCTEDLKRYLSTTIWEKEQLSRLNETVTIAVSPSQQDSALCACKVCLSTISSLYGGRPDLRRSMSIMYCKSHLSLSWTHKQYLPVGGGGMAAGSGLVDGAPGPPWG